MADVEVKVAVAVEVGECGRRGPVTVAAQPISYGGVFEGAVSLVAVQSVLMPACDEKVWVSVVVNVADSYAMTVAPRELGEPRSVGRILKRPVASIVKETVPRRLRGGEVGGETAGLRQVDIEPAVTVIVE